MIPTTFKRFTIFALAVWVLAPIAVNAQTRTLSEGSLAISPFIIENSLLPGQSKKNSIAIFNLSDSPLPIAISINDFVPAGEHGSVRFLETGQVSHPSFSLASWIAITTQPNFTIPPKGQTSVEFTITVPIDAEPGTHYGGLLFSARETSPKEDNITIIKKVGAIILVGAGNTNASGIIEKFAVSKKFYTAAPVTLISAFKNAGNVHVQPKGQVAIHNMFGKVIGESHINENAQYILPGSTRTFEASFSEPWLFGRYSAELTMYYGNPKLEARGTAVFWVIPIKQLGLYGGLLVLLLAACYIGIKCYNSWIIRKNNNRSDPL